MPVAQPGNVSWTPLSYMYCPTLCSGHREQWRRAWGIRLGAVADGQGFCALFESKVSISSYLAFRLDQVEPRWDWDFASFVWGVVSLCKLCSYTDRDADFEALRCKIKLTGNSWVVTDANFWSYATLILPFRTHCVVRRLAIIVWSCLILMLCISNGRRAFGSSGSTVCSEDFSRWLKSWDFFDMLGLPPRALFLGRSSSTRFVEHTDYLSLLDSSDHSVFMFARFVEFHIFWGRILYPIFENQACGNL